MSLLGLEKLPPEIASALEPVIQQLEGRVDGMMQSALGRVDKIVESALDRIDGAQVVVVCTIKLPQAGAKMAVPEGQ
jgi:hypothetical protein